MDGVERKRTRRRMSWQDHCQEEKTRAIRNLGEDEDDTEGPKRKRNLRQNMEPAPRKKKTIQAKTQKKMGK